MPVEPRLLPSEEAAALSPEERASRLKAAVSARLADKDNPPMKAWNPGKEARDAG